MEDKGIEDKIGMNDHLYSRIIAIGGSDAQ
jgi:hypothetical protein